MGASVSCPTEKINEEQARAFVGAAWNEEAGKKWNELVGEGTTVSAAAAADAAGALGLPVLKEVVCVEPAMATIDMSDPAIRMMVRLAGNSTKMHHLQELFREINSPEIIEQRRARVRKAAGDALAEFAKLSEEEREKTRAQGDLDMYTPEAQATREEIFVSHGGVGDELEKWWEAASLFFDDNWDEYLNKAEYAAFHDRLLRLVADGDELSPEDAAEALDADFAVDAGDDDRVSHEEFRYAMFQLADHWTVSLEAAEYVEFLRLGHETVFADLIASDKVKVPEVWRKKLRGFKGGRAAALIKARMPTDMIIEMISEIYATKLTSNRAATAKGRARDPMAKFTVAYFIRKFGLDTKFLVVKFKEFQNGVLKIIEDGGHVFHDYVLVFAQMVGFEAKSGRVVAFTPGTCCFMMDFFQDLQPIMGKIKGETTMIDTYLEEVLRNKKVAACFGYLMADDVEKMVADRVEKVLGVGRDAPLFRCLHFAFMAICQKKEFTHAGRPCLVHVTTAVDAMTFIGTIAGAAEVVNNRAQKNQPEVIRVMKGGAKKDGGEDEVRAPEAASPSATRK